MAQIEREYLHLSSGVDYIEYHYFDYNGNPTDSNLAKKCIAYECDKAGNILKKLDCQVVSKTDTAINKIGIRLPKKTIRKFRYMFSAICNKWAKPFSNKHE